jgi:hypothetical protein
MARYAAETSVPADRSRVEIERTLERYGATEFMYGWQSRRALIGFSCQKLSVRFELELPDRDAAEFKLTPSRRSRSETSAKEAWEQACRQRWRALALLVKAKLEAVESGIATFEEEVLPHIVMPDNRRVLDHALPAMRRALESGTVQRLLPPGPKE